MRPVIGFLSLLAAGLIIAVAFGLVTRPAGCATATTAGLDYMSLTLGLALGLSLAQFERVHWGELPRRIAGWMLLNERNFYRWIWAAILLAVLLYY